MQALLKMLAQAAARLPLILAPAGLVVQAVLVMAALEQGLVVLAPEQHLVVLLVASALAAGLWV